MKPPPISHERLVVQERHEHEHQVQEHKAALFKRPPRAHNRQTHETRHKSAQKKKPLTDFVGEAAAERRLHNTLLEGHPYASALVDSMGEVSGQGSAVPVVDVALTQLMEQIASGALVASSALLSTEDSPLSFIMHPSKGPYSPFTGTRITITEYSTAPLRFNIEIATTPEGLRVLQAHQAELFRFFEEGSFDFGVERIDILLETQDPPQTHRQDKEDQEAL